MRMKLLGIVAVAAALGLAPGAFADGQGKGHQKAKGKGHAKHGDEAPADRTGKFREWDRNSDGALQRGEYPGHPGNFRALDTDGNGELSLDEFVHRAGVRAPESARDDFDAKDHDRNGTISRSEWPDTWEFERRDRNDDGRVTRGEYENPRPVSARDDEFRRLDTNNDGYVSRSEWRGRSTAFDQHDRNDDGLISRDEFTRPRGVLSKQ